MSTMVEIKGYIMALKSFDSDTMSHVWKPCSFIAWPYEGGPPDSTEYQLVLAPHTIYAEIPTFDPVSGEIAALEAVIKKTRAEAEEKVRDLRVSINNLLALPAPESK